MGYLTAAVIFVGTLCAFDLLLSLGVIRRLREHSEVLRQLTAMTSAVTVPVGQTVDAFDATTHTGRVVSRSSLPARTLVGFFSPSCTACHEALPEFVDYARRFQGSVLSVAVGDDRETAELVERLAALGDVVVERDGGPVALAFGVSGLPALCVLDAHGDVVASASRTRSLPLGAPA
jgi:hypothetical protein